MDNKIDGNTLVGERAPFNASNEPGTCLWCGKKLRPIPHAPKGWEERVGGYADNAFCSLRHGYMFGLTLAHLGKILTKRG